MVFVKCQIWGRYFVQQEAQNRLLIFKTSSERPLSKLSENHVIGPTEQKLWPFKYALFNVVVVLSYLLSSLF